MLFLKHLRKLPLVMIVMAILIVGCSSQSGNVETNAEKSSSGEETPIAGEFNSEPSAKQEPSMQSQAPSEPDMQSQRRPSPDMQSQEQPSNQMQPGMPGSQPQTDIEVKDKELKKFAKTVTEIEKVNTGVQEKMVKAIKDEGLEPEQFSKMMKGMQQPGASQDEFSKEEQQKGQKVMQSMQKIQMDVQKEAQSMIQENGFEVQRFQEIAMALRSDQDLQKRFSEMQSEIAPPEEESGAVEEGAEEEGSNE